MPNQKISERELINEMLGMIIDLQTRIILLEEELIYQRWKTRFSEETRRLMIVEKSVPFDATLEAYVEYEHEKK